MTTAAVVDDVYAPRRLPESQLRNSSLFRRVNASTVGMQHDALCRKDQWVPRSARHSCSNCKRDFGLLQPKHHCRLCGEVVCGQCSSKRIVFNRKSVRSCDECVNTTVCSLPRELNLTASAVSEASDVSSSADLDLDEASTTSKQRRDSSATVSPAVDAVSHRVSIAHPRGLAGRARSGSACAIAQYRSYYHEEAWRSQLPYAIVLLLMTIAGITNIVHA
ncbi:hypothetical protein P43SY_008321 [Pythium insidiosum]|uniref:FYVE-type domain-containing protein n=1 Tax=Pythium insidiosum TaxID=114742 RepID=A0AAD5LXV5_PYTIN|nr:hypothetical protein P43SY_008321 [Pythium insidiosum]